MNEKEQEVFRQEREKNLYPNRELRDSVYDLAAIWTAHILAGCTECPYHEEIQEAITKLTWQPEVRHASRQGEMRLEE